MHRQTAGHHPRRFGTFGFVFAPLSVFARIVVICGVAVFLCVFLVLDASSAAAQTQEARMDEILHADRNQTSSFVGKTFATSASVGSKQAQVKSFAFGGKSSVLSGDGKFRAKGFENPRGDGFRTEGYLAKASTVSQRNSFAQADKGFGTKSMDVRDAPGTGKSAQVKEFVPAEQTFSGRGKRQDLLDEKAKDAKNLSIDQVRDLLNKGPAEKPGTILEPMRPVVR